jgi:hypothetical protein
MEAISDRKTIQVSQWKRQLLDGASELFTRGKTTKDKGNGQAKDAELCQHIGRQQIELPWLKTSLSSCDAHELRKLVGHDHPLVSISRPYALLGVVSHQVRQRSSSASRC